MAIIKTVEATYVSARTASWKATDNYTLNDWTSASLSGSVGTYSANPPMRGTAYTLLIKFTTPTFNGTCTNLNIKLKMKSTSNTEAKLNVFVSSNLSNAENGTHLMPKTSSNVTISGLTSTAKYFSIDLHDSLLSNTTYCLYICSYEPSYNAWSELDMLEVCDASSSTVTLTLTYEAPYGCAKIRTSASSTKSGYPHIFVDGEWKPCSPYVYYNGAWHECEE